MAAVTSPNRSFIDWREVIQQAAAWLVIGGIAGIGWLSYHVPRQLDRILHNQQRFAEQSQEIDQRVDSLETTVKAHDTRITRLEAQ
jgi:hypothetical protein